MFCDIRGGMVTQSGESQEIIRPYMPELDSVRGIAILMVLFFHGLAPPLSSPVAGWARTLLAFTQAGWTGVNLFFVLSGFLITGILLDSKARPDYFQRFYLRRVLRILPALYLTLAALWLIGQISWRFLALSAFFLANSVNFFGQALQYGPLWSLAVEEHFYLLWPSLVRKFSSSTLALVLTLIWLGTPALRIVCWLTGHFPQHAAVFNTWFNLDGLALGSLLALGVRHPLFSRRRLQQLAPVALLGGVAAFVVFSGNSFTVCTLLSSSCNLASAGLLASMLLLGTSRWNFLVDRPVLKFFGFISYGLYLIHLLTFHLVERLLNPLWAPLISIAGPTATMFLRFALGAGAGIGIAYLSRRSLEEKFLRMRFRTRTAPAAVESTVAG
jgi:peptidoglycan/LPS O-acetylase OafA/YrhL